MTANNEKHDLHDFMAQITKDIAAEYAGIRKRTSEDPGTAGDQGEENWAEILRGWLPPKYPVVTRGRIISAEGQTSGQVDVLVLKESYPPKLLNKKLYLAAGVGRPLQAATPPDLAQMRPALEVPVALEEVLLDVGVVSHLTDDYCPTKSQTGARDYPVADRLFDQVGGVFEADFHFRIMGRMRRSDNHCLFSLERDFHEGRVYLALGFRISEREVVALASGDKFPLVQLSGLGITTRFP